MPSFTSLLKYDIDMNSLSFFSECTEDVLTPKLSGFFSTRLIEWVFHLKCPIFQLLQTYAPLTYSIIFYHFISLSFSQNVNHRLNPYRDSDKNCFLSTTVICGPMKLLTALKSFIRLSYWPIVDFRQRKTSHDFVTNFVTKYADYGLQWHRAHLSSRTELSRPLTPVIPLL